MFEKQDEYKNDLDRIRDYRVIFGSPLGKKVLYDIIKQSHVIGSAFSRESQYLSAFMEGERNVALRIMSLMERDPEEIKQRMNEGVSNE